MKFFYLTLFLFSSSNATDMRALLFHGNCTTCHNETKTLSAPSVIEFKENYLRAFSIKKDFVEYMSQWVINPSEETSIMLDAIKKHELMPQLGFDISTLREISTYIYDTDFTKKHEGDED